MTTQAQEATVRHQIAVAAPVDRAFRVFTGQMDKIKPREHNMLGVDIDETVFEPRAGGRIYDRGTDGSECEWASVIAYEPPDRVVFSWNITPHWQVETDPGGTARRRRRAGRLAALPAAVRRSPELRLGRAPADSSAGAHEQVLVRQVDEAIPTDLDVAAGRQFADVDEVASQTRGDRGFAGSPAPAGRPVRSTPWR